MRRTLSCFRATPQRGQALALEVGGQVSGYALLSALWSNELGGEVCLVDELYVAPPLRGHRHATQLLDALGERRVPFAATACALLIETTPKNDRARRLYERVGFSGRNVLLRRVLVT